MVTTAVNVPSVQYENLARSTDTSWQGEVAPARVARSISIGKQQKLIWKPTGEELQSQSIDLPEAASMAVLAKATGAEVPSRAQESVGTYYLLFYNPEPTKKAELKSKIADLPFRGQLVTSFEPHLRQSTVRDLQSLLTQFQHSIGKPTAAIAKAELIDTLASTYKRSALNAETRNFASAVSLLQDFLRPHWSEISTDTVDAVSKSLNTLVSRT